MNGGNSGGDGDICCGIRPIVWRQGEQLNDRDDENNFSDFIRRLCSRVCIAFHSIIACTTSLARIANDSNPKLKLNPRPSVSSSSFVGVQSSKYTNIYYIEFIKRDRICARGTEISNHCTQKKKKLSVI